MSFLNTTSSLLDLFQANRKIDQGVSLQNSALEMSALGFTQAANATRASAEYNIELDRQQMIRRLDIFGRQVSQLIATQDTQKAVSGASLGSKSFLSLTNNTLDIAMRQVGQMRDAQRTQAQNRRHEAKVQEVNLQNQALAARYQAEVNIYRSKQQKSDIFGSAVSTILGSVGGFF